MRARRLALAAAALALLGAAAAPARAQEVRVEGGGQSRAEQIVREILARRNYLRLDRDTVLPATFRTAGDLVVYDADVRLEGTVEGSVAVLGGDFFIRPGARVAGPIAVIDGGVYNSRLATTGEVVTAPPGTRIRLPGDSAAGPTLAAGDTARPGAPRADTLVIAGEDRPLEAEIVGPPPPRRFGFLFFPPSYDRVNGLTLRAGASGLLSDDPEGLRVEAWAAYRGENPDHIGGGVRADLPLGVQALRLQAEASRATRTNDAWIRGDLSNSLAVALSGKDYRDYYDADVARVMLARPVDKPLIAGESWLGPRVGAMISRDRSLREKNVWSVYDSDEKGRVNPPVLEGTIVSALAGTELRWRGATSTFIGDVMVEQAFSGAGDVGFTQVVGDMTFTAYAFRTHFLSVYFRGMAPLNEDGAPPQRFGLLGGSGTLPTLAVGHFRGDHLFFVESSYSVPLQQLALPFLGPPSLQLSHAAGAAWETGEGMPPWVQNVGAGLAFRFFRVRLVLDPEEADKPKFEYSISIPRT